jgi:glycolate oxidase FAD binding subunit
MIHITLASLIGAEYLQATPDGYVAIPETTEQLAQVVAACNAAGMPVVPWGGGTHQSWGGAPPTPFVAVQTTRLNRVLDYTPDDLTISVEAGMTLAALDATLAANGQMLPLDAPLPERSTIGGMLATAADGPRRLAYGTARDLLIGIRVVEATGRISKAGGMVVKNVSGFDMMKLYLGSMGTLAIIVSANFKLLPRPRAVGALSCVFANSDTAFAFVGALHASQLTPAAVEYQEGWSHDPAAPISVEVRIEGLPAAVARHLRDLPALAAQAGAAQTIVYESGDPVIEPHWAALNDRAQTAELAADELVLRLSCLPADLFAALGDARELASRHGVKLRVSARALNGMAYLRGQGEDGALRSWHADLLNRRPHLAVIGAAPHLCAELPLWGAPSPNLELMRRIKHEFDPGNSLNPGRFVV